MSNQEWISKYRSNKQAIWIKCELTDGSKHYHDQFSGWMEIKELCKKNKCFIKDLKLSYRSHEVNIDLEEAEGIYLIRSAMGQMGQETKNFYTTGVLKRGIVHKKMWLIPELVVEKELEDDLGDCFEEALIRDEQKKSN